MARLRLAQAACRLGQLDQRAAKLGELLVGLRNSLREPGDLFDSARSSPGEPDGAALELALHTEPGRLDAEGAGVSVGQRTLDMVEPRRGRRGQRPDVIEDGSAVERVLRHESIIRLGA